MIVVWCILCFLTHPSPDPFLLPAFVQSLTFFLSPFYIPPSNLRRHWCVGCVFLLNALAYRGVALQRLRDQIKTWLASSDVKAQRTTLMENRRLIEVQMERFKIIERETKTKAFSKEGLAAAAKVDPRQKERNETREWLNNCADELKQQVEQLEAEIEQLSAGKKKKSKSADERESTLNETIERHTFHITKFEMLMRLLDKGEHEGQCIKPPHPTGI